MKQKRKKNTGNISLVFESLEPRILLAADFALGLDAPKTWADHDPEAERDFAAYLRELPTPQASAALIHVPSATAPAALDMDALHALHDSTAATTDSSDRDASRHELIVIDAGVKDPALLIADIQARNDGETRYDIVVLNGEQDGITQLSATLATRADLDAVHIFSHGNARALQLGGGWLNLEALHNAADSVSTWREAFSEDADLLLYGCELAGSGEGQSLIDTLGALTGADVAASDDLTGHARLGGDWTLPVTASAMAGPARRIDFSRRRERLRQHDRHRIEQRRLHRR